MVVNLLNSFKWGLTFLQPLLLIQLCHPQRSLLWTRNSMTSTVVSSIHASWNYFKPSLTWNGMSFHVRGIHNSFRDDAPCCYRAHPISKNHNTVLQIRLISSGSSKSDVSYTLINKCKVGNVIESVCHMSLVKGRILGCTFILTFKLCYGNPYVPIK